MTGMGRTGKNFAVEHWDIAPDILIAAKGLSSGYAPLGAVIATKKVVDGIASGAFLHGFTYNAHPVSMAAGRAVLRRLQQQNLVQASDSGREGTVAAKLERSLSTLAGLEDGWRGPRHRTAARRGVRFRQAKQEAVRPGTEFRRTRDRRRPEARPAGLSHSRLRRRDLRRPPADRPPGGHHRRANRLGGPAAEENPSKKQPTSSAGVPPAVVGASRPHFRRNVARVIACTQLPCTLSITYEITCD